MNTRWSTGEACRQPGRMGIDSIHRHLFIACGNGHFVVMDSDFGAVESEFDAPAGIGDLVYDQSLNRVFAASSTGVLLSIGSGVDGHYGLLSTSPTLPGASLLALDARDHRLFSLIPDAGDADTISNGQTLLTITRQ